MRKQVRWLRRQNRPKFPKARYHESIVREAVRSVRTAGDLGGSLRRTGRQSEARRRLEEAEGRGERPCVGGWKSRVKRGRVRLVGAYFPMLDL